MKNTKLNVQENWKKVRGKLIQQYAEFIDNDLLFNEGQDDISLHTFYTKTLENKEFLKIYSRQNF